MESPLDGVRLSLVESIDDLMEMKRWAGERRDTPLMFDTETGGLSPEKNQVRLIQLGDTRRGWAVPFQMWGGGAIELLKNYEGRLGAHNRSFDCRFLMNHAGWQPPWEKIDDTLTMAHLLDPLRPRGLKPLADRLVDRRASAGERILHDGMKKQKWTWDTVPVSFKPYWIYAAADPVLTAHIWLKLQPQVAEKYSQVYDFEQEVNRVCAMMMLKGMKVDLEYIHQKLSAISSYSASVRAWLSENYQVDSPMGNIKITRALERLGQEIRKGEEFETAGGAPKMDKENLAWYRDNAVSAEVRVLCETILTARHAEKMAGTYLENLISLRDAYDVVHCNIWPLGARTGRMSITDPALQTLPRDDLVIRGAFIPRPGHVLISCDYDQIEMRLSAHFAADDGLIQAFLQADEPGGTDFFSSIASELFRREIRKGDKRRQMVKNMSYARIYGAGVAKMALTAGVTVEQMKPVKDAFDNRYPGLSRMAESIVNNARHAAEAGGRPGVFTPLGRFLPGESGREYALVNYLIQSHASEILKQAMINLAAAGLQDYMLLPVHDEIVFEVPEIEADAAAKLIRDTMENRTDYSVPITCEPKIMPERWVGKN